MSQWEEWGECSNTCGSGHQSRRRTMVIESKNGGKQCEEPSQSRDCNYDKCGKLYLSYVKLTNFIEFLQHRRDCILALENQICGWNSRLLIGTTIVYYKMTKFVRF